MDTEHRHPDDERIAAVTGAIQALDTPAPASLRAAAGAAAAKAEAEQGASARRGGLRPGALGDVFGALRPRTLLAGGGIVAVLVAVVLVLALPGGAAQPSVHEVAGVALSQATAPAPGEGADARHLDASVESVSFPDWSGWTRGPGGGWRATGARSDDVGDRAVHTVFYANGEGQRIGYSIADGEKLPVGDGRWAKYDGRPMWIYDVDGQTAVMWYRDGLTCVVAGDGVDVDTLKELAAAHTT
jgi:hypothetical protein